MAAAQKRVVRHALFVYTDPDRGSRRVAYRGDTVRVDGEDLERGERLGVFVPDGEELKPAAAPEPTPVDEVPSPASAQAGDDDELADTGAAEVDEADGEEPAAERPPRAAAKEAWVDFAVAHGCDRAEAEAMTKADLIAAFGA